MVIINGGVVVQNVKEENFIRMVRVIVLVKKYQNLNIKKGVEEHTLKINELPEHTHKFYTNNNKELRIK